MARTSDGRLLGRIDNLLRNIRIDISTGYREPDPMAPTLKKKDVEILKAVISGIRSSRCEICHLLNCCCRIERINEQDDQKQRERY